METVFLFFEENQERKLVMGKEFYFLRRTPVGVIGVSICGQLISNGNGQPISVKWFLSGSPQNLC
jgi:hypothetical protein